MKQFLEGELLARMLIHASASLNLEKQTINELNVFPVPDGDTGTNMSLTMGAAASELGQKRPGTVGEAAAIAASAMLRGARGNSGVILSLLFRGFAKAVKDMDTIEGPDFAEALQAGVTAAYKAVMKPVEGTLLTVSRMAAVSAADAAAEDPDMEGVLEKTIEAAKEALAQTVEQNPVLKKAGVVDAGGMGYVIILQSMLDQLQGKPMPARGEEEAPKASAFQAFSTEEITFGYCTEFICARESKKDPEALRTFLDKLGDSLVLVEDEEIIKVHVHTNHPGKALEEALTYGALLTVKIENMREQHTEILEEQEIAAAQEQPVKDYVAPPEKKFGVVSVCAGEGFRTLFRELGADGIISGGQTMNPSTEDILREINKTPAEIVYVLPNNKNIIMAAQQCVALVEEKKVVVLPTGTIPQGISALLCLDHDLEEAENTAAMEAALATVTTVEITHAARNSEFDGTPIREGDYLALMDNQLFGTEETQEAMIAKVAAAFAGRSPDFINVFCGEDIDMDQGERVVEALQEACPDAEITLLSGGQPVYLYVISAE